jgi:O-antigen/teichoic acid export membrane protein
LVYLAIAVVLALIYAIRQRSRLRKVGPKLVFALVIVALGFAALLPGWSFGWFVAALVILGAWLAWHILLAVALELTLCVDGVGRWVEGYQTPAVIILMVELETGVLTACGSMIEAKLGNGYVTAAVIIGFVVTVMAAWLMIYRQSLSSLIRGDRLVT